MSVCEPVAGNGGGGGGRGSAESDAAGRCWREADGWHVELRGLDPPQPLTLILRLITHGIDGIPIGSLTLHHDRDPVLLYDELEPLGWTATALPAPPGEVCLRLSAPDDPKPP